MIMKIFFDTEFLELPTETLLLSIGLIRDDGKSYYAELDSTDRSLANDWVKENVLPLMNGPVKSRNVIAFEIKEFCENNPEFWAFFGMFDMILLMRLFDGMIAWPETWPQYVNDICKLGPEKIIPPQSSIKHHALNDAIWVKYAYEYLVK